MLKAVARDGEPRICLCGLSAHNIDQIVAGHPLFFSLADMDPAMRWGVMVFVDDEQRGAYLVKDRTLDGMPVLGISLTPEMAGSLVSGRSAYMTDFSEKIPGGPKLHVFGASTDDDLLLECQRRGYLGPETVVRMPIGDEFPELS